MEGHNFDRIARALGTGRSRRSVIKGLVGSWVGGMAAVKTISQAGAQEGCLEVYATCNVNDTESTCCEGTTCFWADGEGVGSCEFDYNLCSFEGESCAELPCCGSNSFCNDSGVCEYDDYEQCGVIDEFCGEYGKGQYRACCEGHECIERDEVSFCDPIQPVCVPEGEFCGQVTLAQAGGDSVCCDDLVCNDELICAPPVVVVCSAETEPCGPLSGDAPYECCDDLICLDEKGTGGVCGHAPDPKPGPKPEPKPQVPVTQLTDTGAGSNQDATAWIAPAAAAAAAAVIGTKLLKNGNSGTPDTTL